MSITVRIFTHKELEKIATGKPSRLTTILLNKKSLTIYEAVTRAKVSDVKTFSVLFSDGLSTQIKAQTRRLAIWFVNEQWKHDSVESIAEVTVVYDVFYTRGEK